MLSGGRPRDYYSYNLNRSETILHSLCGFFFFFGNATSSGRCKPSIKAESVGHVLCCCYVCFFVCCLLLNSESGGRFLLEN